MTFQAEDALDQAMVLGYGADNGPLLHLIGEIMRILAPRGEWLDDHATSISVALGLNRLLQRLGTPDHYDITEYDIARNDPRRRVDELLFDLGDDGSDHPGPLTGNQRWAAEKRRRFGTLLSARLIKMRQVVRNALEAGPSREPPPADPSIQARWAAVLAKEAGKVEAIESEVSPPNET